MKNQWIELVPSDIALAEEVADYYRRNREFLRETEPEREPFFYTREYQEVILLRERENRENSTAWRFYIRAADCPGKIIGIIGLNNVVWGAFCSAHLGYKLDKDHCGKGYMTMAVAMITEYAFRELGLHRIEGNVMPKNKASLRVLEKNGYENEGYSKFYLKINGVWEDHIHMVKLNEAMHRD